MKLTLKYYLGNISTNPPRIRTVVMDVEVDDSFFFLSDEKKQKVLTEAGSHLLQAGEEVGGVEGVERFKP